MKLAILVLVCAVCLHSVALARREHPKRPRPSEPVPKKERGEPWNKGKRETLISSGYSYPGPPRSSHLLHLHGGSSLNIGAGYSLGSSSSKPSSISYSFPGGSLGAVGTLGLGHTYGGHYQPIVHSPSFGDHASQPTKIRYTSVSGSSFKNQGSGGKFGSFFGGGGGGGGPQSFGHASSQFVFKPQMASYVGVPQYSQSKPEVSFSVPATFMQTSHASLPSYAAGTQGLGAYASASTHPLSLSGHLFMPAHEAPTVSYGSPSSSSHAGFSLGSGSSENKFAGFFSGNYKPTFESHAPATHGLSSSLNSIGGHSVSSSIGGHGISSSIGGHGLSSSSSSSGGHAEFKPSLFLGSSEPSIASGLHESTSYSHQAPSFANSLPSSLRSSLLAGNPVYITPKGVAEVLKASGFDTSNTFTLEGAGKGGEYHASASLTGNHEIPSAGHAAPIISFGGSSEHYASPSVSYGSPSVAQVGHDSDSGSSGGYAGHAAVVSSSYSTPSVSHVSYDTPTSGHTSISSTFGGFGSGQHQASSPISYASSSSSGGGHSDGGNFGAVGSFGKGSSFLGTSSYSASSLSDQDGAKDSAYVPQETYGPPKGSYSTNRNVYANPPANQKYDTIKYSRDISEEEILHT